MNVLLIEDSAGFAIPMIRELEAKGHVITWIVGAERLENSRIIGIIANPSAGPLDESWDGDRSRLIEIDARQFDVALCDGGLVGPVNDGIDFVAYLSKLSVPCICITGGGAGNQRLLEAGAVAGLPKEFVVLAIKSGKLNFNTLLRRQTVFATSLQSYCSGVRAKFLKSRSNGTKFSLGYPELDRCA